MRSLLAAFVLCLVAALSACSTTAPQRYAYTEGGRECEPVSDDGQTSGSCRHEIFERAPKNGYELHFVEFDDQGWLSGPRPEDPAYRAAEQLDLLSDRLRRLASEACAKPVSLVVYVHGWKHDATAEDGNVESFRRILRGLSKLEANQLGARQVVGVYVGWRGDSTLLPEPLKSLTFWNRKDAVERVSQGTVRELFARVTTLADIANEPWSRFAEAAHAGDAAPCNGMKPVRTLIIGHSFGGHALVTALSNLILRSLVTMQEKSRMPSGELGPSAGSRQTTRLSGIDAAPGVGATLQREGDLIILVNPAIEGSRFEPLHRVAQQVAPEQRYRAPLLVSFTSTADSATGVFFPLGRAISTTAERYGAYSEADEREANLKTLGHNDRYVTHEVIQVPALAECAGWDPKGNLDAQAAIEVRVHEAFLARIADPTQTEEALARRSFCPNWQLVHRGGAFKPYAPVMNIQVGKELISSHSDITNDQFVVFVRQLYLDSADRVLQRLKQLPLAPR